MDRGAGRARHKRCTAAGAGPFSALLVSILLRVRGRRAGRRVLWVSDVCRWAYGGDDQMTLK